MLYSIFHLGNNLIGVPIYTILEIVRSNKFHPVRGGSEVIDGLINLRGKVVTVINTGIAFETQKVAISDESRIYIFKNNAELKELTDINSDEDMSPDNIGLHVEKIEGVINVDKDELQAVPTNMAHPFYQHVVRRGEDFIIILKPSKAIILNSTETVKP